MAFNIYKRRYISDLPKYLLKSSIRNGWSAGLISAILLVLVCPLIGQENPSILSFVHYKFDPLEGEPNISEKLRIKPDPTGDNYYIVQFEGPTQQFWLKELTGLGATLYDYVPFFALIVRMDEQTRSEVERLPFVRWVGMFHPAYKLDPKIGKLRYDPEDPLYTLVLSFFPDVDIQSANRRIEKIGGETSNLAYFPEHRVVRLDVHIEPEAVDKLAFIPEIKWITPKGRKELKNHSTCFFVQEFSGGTIPAAGDTSIWRRGIHGENQIIGFADTGLDYNHCAFRDPAHLESFGSSHRKIVRNQTYGAGAQLYDGETDGHGSHVCGTAAGDQSYITGSSYNNGMAYEAKISFADVVSCAGSFSSFAFLTVLNDAYNDGARIHSNSWGYGTTTAGNYQYEAVDADAFMWDNKDMLILFANGNDGPTYRVEPPATAKDIVSVGATGGTSNSGYNFRDENEMTDYSCPGPCDDGRRKPTITAPGHFIESVDNDDGDCCGTGDCAATCNFEYLTNGSYIWTGTSMACPAAAGCAALVRQYFTEGWYPSGTEIPGDALTPSAALMKAMLVNGALDMTGESSWPTMNQGFGRAELEDVLFFAGDSRVLNIVDETSGLVNSGDADTHYFQVGNSEPLEITLVWTDHEAAELADPCIINDLDLRIQFGGNVYRGNVFSGRQSTTGGSYDRLNVVEEFLLNSPPAAECTVIVNAYSITYSPQPYALVLTGDLPCNHIPDAPTLNKLFDNERMPDQTPTLEWDVPVDDDGDALDFKVQIDDDADFGSPFATIESRLNTAGFSPVPPRPEGTGTCSYTVGSQGEGSLADRVTYYWRVAAHDGIAYGDWSTVFSFTVETSQSESDWFQTMDPQFETDSLYGLFATGNALELLSIAASWDTLKRDDGVYEAYDGTGYANNDFNTRVPAPAEPCTLMGAMIWVRNPSADACTLWLIADSMQTGTSHIPKRPASAWVERRFVPVEDDWTYINFTNSEKYYLDSPQELHVVIFTESGNTRICLDQTSDSMDANGDRYSKNNDPHAPWEWTYYYGQSVFLLRAIVKYPASTYDIGKVYSTPIAYADNPGSPTSWDRVIWSENNGDSVRVTIQYRSAGSWVSVADTATILSGATGELDISGFGTEDTIRAVAILYRKGGSSPQFKDWAVTWSFGAPTPNLVHESHVIDDNAGGDDDGIPEPGESIVMPITLFNNGGATATSVVGTLRIVNPYVTITDSIASFPNIDAGTSQQCLPDYYAYDISPMTPCPYTATFTIRWACAENSGTDNFDVDICDPSNTAPGAPVLTNPFPFARLGDGASSITPTLEWDVPSDSDGDDLHFWVQWDTDSAFGSPDGSIESRADNTGFGCAPPVPQGSGTCTYTVDSQGEGALTNGNTYWWRVAAWDGNDYGNWSQIRSFTVNTGLSDEDWHQTTDEQFVKCVMRGGVSISGDNISGMAIPARTDQFNIPITEPSFETTTGWTYTETGDLDYSSLQSTDYVTDGTYNHELIGSANLAAGSYCRYSQTFDMSYFDALLADIYFLAGNNNDNVFSIIRVNSTEEWRDTIRDDGEGAQNNLEIDISAYSGNNDLHFEMYANNNHLGNQREYYFDNVRLGRTIVSEPIYFSWASGATGWDRLEWNESGGNGDFRVTVQEFTGGSWQDIPSLTNLDYNPAGHDISSLGSEDSIRLVGKFTYSSGSPTVSDWTVTWDYSSVGIVLLKGGDSGPVYTDDWDLGIIQEADVRIMDDIWRIYVKNNGSNVAVDLSIKASTTNWTFGPPLGNDQCIVMGLFNSTTIPVEGDYDTGTDYINTTYRAAEVGGNFAGLSDGVNIAIGAGEELYLYFKAPQPNTQSTVQDITITIKADVH